VASFDQAGKLSKEYMTRKGLVMAIVDDSNRKQDLVRGVLEDLKAPDADVRMTRRQIHAMREELDRVESDLDARQHGVAGGLIDRVRRAYRVVFNVGRSEQDIAAFFGSCLNASHRLKAGDSPVDTLISEVEIEALRIAVSVQGTAAVALTMFAMHYPREAARIDRQDLDRLDTAWTAAEEGGRWEVLQYVLHRRLGYKVKAGTIKTNISKLATTFERSEN
jgi:hypothetical protein